MLMLLSMSHIWLVIFLTLFSYLQDIAAWKDCIFTKATCAYLIFDLELINIETTHNYRQISTR